MAVTRHAVGGALIALTLAVGGYVVSRSTGGAEPAGPARIDLSRTDTVLYVDSGRVVRQAPRSDPGAVLASGPTCHRVDAAAGTMVCLRATAVPDQSEITVWGGGPDPRVTLSEWGTPSRARVSPSGALVAWTVFRAGDSYLMGSGGFSTTAGIYDLRSGSHYGSLEDFTSYVDGKRFAAVDANFWGITFAADDRVFYATMKSGQRTWLMRGDLATRELRSVRENVECPSLSPDGTRVAYKFRTGDTWRLHVLDLATGADTPLAEPAHVDDQPAWLDARTIAYTRGTDAYAVPADGTGSPTLLRAKTTALGAVR